MDYLIVLKDSSNLNNLVEIIDSSDKSISVSLENTNVTDDELINFLDELFKKGIKLHSINLAFCKNITDKSMRYLGNCYSVNLSGCNFTNDSICMLKRCYHLKLSYCDLEDIDFRYLDNCVELDLSCTNFNNEDLIYLKKCQKLNLSRCDCLNDEGVWNIRYCAILDLSECRQITDNSIRYLGSCSEINLSYNYNITDQGVKSLGNCKLNITGCWQVSEKCFPFFRYCPELIVSSYVFKERTAELLNQYPNLKLSNN